MQPSAIELNLAAEADSDVANKTAEAEQDKKKQNSSSNGTVKATKLVKAGEAINLFPMQLVLLILSPDYLAVLAYLTLVWQLQVFMNHGHMTQSFVTEITSCRHNMLFLLLAFLLFGLQGVFTILYIVNVMKADNLVILLTSINFGIPVLVFFYLLHLKCQLSGIPKYDSYINRLKAFNKAVCVWSLARLLRGIGGLWDTKLFFGMMYELK